MTKPRILVVDDEESMRYFLRRSLKREGFNVETAASGEEALDLAPEGRFDLVLLDLRLPGRARRSERPSGSPAGLPPRRAPTPVPSSVRRPGRSRRRPAPSPPT